MDGRIGLGKGGGVFRTKIHCSRERAVVFQVSVHADVIDLLQ